MKSSGLNPASRRMLDAAFGRAEEAWLVRGHYDQGDKLRVIEEGPAESFDLPDEDDLYYCVGTVLSGTRASIGRVLVLVVDDVGKEIDLEEFEMFFPLEPSFVVESSAGSFQYGYLIDGGMEPGEYRALREAMKASSVWGGAHNTGAAAIYRLPQGTHTKSTRGGWRVREGLWSGVSHSREKVLAALGGAAVGAPAPATKRFEWELGDEALGELVDLIPNGVGMDRREWVRVAHGISGAGGGFEIFEGFSNRWTEGVVDADETVRVWDTLPVSQSGGGALRAMAEAASPDGFAAWRGKWEAPNVFDDGEVDPAGAGVGVGAPAVADAGVEPVQREVAESIFATHGDRLRFNHDSGCWHGFNGQIWEPLPKSVKAGFRLAERWAFANAGNLRPGDFKMVSKANFYDGVESILRQRLMIRQADFDRDVWLLGTPGGTVDLRTGVLRAARAGDFISRSTAVVPSESEDCVRWLKFLNEICKGDLGAILFLRQWFGYCLSGDTTEQVFLFLYGPGGNGKSVLVDTLGWVLGTYFCKPVADLYLKKTAVRHMQEVAMLAGARMVTISEVPSGSSWDEGRLKEHTGGGPVTANYMRENSFTFVPQFKLTALGNHQPTFPGGINPAIRRRFKMMLLDFVPRVVDRKLEEIFRSEGSGILRWAIGGLCDGAQGWHKTGLMVPAVVDSVTDEYVADQDVFAAWLGDRVEKKPGALTPTETLWRDFTEYRNSRGEALEMYNTLRGFTTEMERRGFSRSRTTAARGFRGIVLKTKTNSVFDDDGS